MNKKNHENKELNNSEIIENDERLEESVDLYENMVEDLFNKYASKMDRMFSKGIYSFNIEEQLQSLSKESVYSIARNIGMSKISTLNKDKLIEKVLDEYNTLMEKQFIFFEEERYEILSSYVKNNGIKIFDEIDEHEMSKTAYLMQQGFIFPSLKDEKAVFLMPEIVQNLVIQMNNPHYKDRIKVNGEILNIYRGLNQAYGVLETKYINEIIKRYPIENLEFYEVETVIREGQYYYKEYREEKNFFINNNIENWSELVEDIEKENKELEYAFISKDELLSMVQKNYMFNSKFGKKFYKEFSGTFEINKDMAMQIMEDLSFDIQDNNVEETANGLLELINESNDNIKSYIKSITIKFISNIRLWKYKGASINDINGKKNTVIVTQTVGRNEPCLCGSGKKYKKCCGKA